MEGGGLFTEQPWAKWDLADIFVGGGQCVPLWPCELSGAWDLQVLETQPVFGTICTAHLPLLPKEGGVRQN